MSIYQLSETVESMARDIEARTVELNEAIASFCKDGTGCSEGAGSARAAQRWLLLSARNASDAAVRLYTLIRQSEPRGGARGMQGPNGMTWPEWEAAAGYGRTATREAWLAGEDPAEHRGG